MKPTHLAGLALAATMLLTAACNRDDDDAINPGGGSSGTTKLSSIEFPNPSSSGPAMQRWDAEYTGSNLTKFNRPVSGGYITLEYSGANPTKINFFLGSGTTPSGYYELAYDGSGRLAASTLYQGRTLGSSTFDPEFGFTYQYDGSGRVSRKDERLANGNGGPLNPFAYYLYTYGSDGSLKEMKEYDDDGTYEGVYTYTCNSNRNTLKDIFPRFHVLGFYTETNWTSTFSIAHVENQYLSDFCVVKEVYQSTGGSSYTRNTATPTTARATQSRRLQTTEIVRCTLTSSGTISSNEKAGHIACLFYSRLKCLAMRFAYPQSPCQQSSTGFSTPAI